MSRIQQTPPGASSARFPSTGVPTFGDLDGRASLLGDPFVRQDSRVRVYVPSYGNGGVLVFDSTGWRPRDDRSHRD